MPSAPPPGPSWRPTVTQLVPVEPTGPRWRRESQGGDGGHWQRRLRVGGLIGAFLLCTGLLIWASFWLFPPQAAGLVLVGAGYETNLAVPANVPGRESMKELAAWTNSQPASFSWRSGLLKLKPEPVELQKNVAWDTALTRVDEKTIVLYFAMHGASDARGAYLIRQDADGSDPEHDFLRISEILERLKKLPASKNKVIIFDATQVPALWSFGVLHNDFARALEQLDRDGKIAEIPNLVILSASATDQQSWASDELKRTLFSYYVLEGLKGAADANGDGRVDALELHDFVNDRVKRWVLANRGAVQTPVLLPEAHGKERASKIHLTMVPTPYQSSDPIPSSGWAPPAELTKAWDNAARLAALMPPPEVYSPQVWQQYRATLLRYEQLLRAGDESNASVMAGKLQNLERQIEQEKRLPLASASNTLTMSNLAGAAPLKPDAAAIFEKVWGAETEEMASTWTKEQAKLPADLEQRQTLRLQLLGLVIQRTGENPRENLIKATQLIGLLNDPAVPRPAEAHFLLMLGLELQKKHQQNPRLMSAEFAGLITLALKVRVQAEQAALGLPSNSHPYSERVRPWIEPLIQAADEQRALGQDLLFIRDTARWAKARENLLAAQKMYEDADRRAHSLATAFMVRDRLFAELPGFTQMVASQRNDNDAEKQVEALWHAAHALAATLDAPPDLTPDATLHLTQLSSNAQKTLKDFNDLKSLNESRLSDASERNSLNDWFEIDAALWYPSWPAKLRTRALANQRTIEQQLMRKTEYNYARASAPSPEALKKQTVEQGQRQGRLALAVLGENAFEEVKGDNLESIKGVTYLVDNVHLENDQWWRSLANAGDNIGRRWQGLTTKADSLTTKSRQQDLKDARAALHRADRLTHQLDGTSNARLSENPATADRKMLLHDFLLWQGNRTLDEHWFAENDGEPRSKPYYQEAGRRYADDAQKMVTGVQTQTATALLARLNKPDRLVMPQPPAQVLTSERSVEITCQVQPTEGEKFRPGYAVFRLESGPLLKTSFAGTDTKAEPAYVAELKAPDKVEKIHLLVGQNLSTLAVSSHKETAQVTVHGYFRGQILEDNTPVELHPLAAKVYYEYPLPLTRAVAVRTTPQLQASFGDGTGSIAIVLDCSGSMGSDPQNPMAKSKFDETTAALQEVLGALPRGTTVSLWVFGQAVGASKTVTNAEETITRLLEPTAWNPEDTEQLPALMKKVRDLEPWNESPIVQTILAAKDDVAKGKGAKTIVVLTDGYDNRFGKDSKPAKSIATTLHDAFQDSGITVNVVGFKFVSKEEEDLARRQFKVLETLTPPGRFFATNEAGKLAAQLREAMRQRLRYWIDREDNEKLPEIPDTGLELSSGSSNDRWYRFPESLPPGGYKMRVDTNRRVLQNVIINRGELLLLNLVAGAKGAEWQRAFVTRDDYGDKPGESSGDWRLVAVQNQRVKDRGLQMLLMLDKAPERAEATLQQQRPRETWLEVSSSAGPSATFDLRWGYQPGYAAPAWNIESPEWPTVRGTQTVAQPRVRMWWSPILDTPPDAFVARSAELPTLLHATNVSRPMEDDTVVIDSVEVEIHRVETQPGKFEDKRCLVVRVTHPQAKPVKVRVEGVAPAGQEHRYYPEAGKYTALFWPVEEAQARSGLSRINLISINRFKSLAEKNGHVISLDKLNEPQSTDVRPQTPIEIKYE